MKVFFKSTLLTFSALILSAMPWQSAIAKSKASAPTSFPPLAGEIQNQNGQAVLFLEEGRRLIWPEAGPAQLQDATNKVLHQINWSETVHKNSALESVVPQVEEVDLGQSKTSKTYLKGKKDPQGKNFNASSITPQTAASLSLKKSSKNDQGIERTVSEAQDGSKIIQFQWPDGSREEVRFDRRGTLIQLLQEKNLNGFEYRLEQWSDGSYTRIYRKASGEFRDIFDATDGGYRLVFYNAKNEVLSELRCQLNCEIN